MNKVKWVFSPVTAEAERLSAELGIPLELAQILFNRGINNPEAAHEFLHGTLDSGHDPFLMNGMRQAVKRIREAISRKETILVFSDYDVDGVLSVVMLLKALKSLGAEVDYFIPERLSEGYGLKKNHITMVLEKNARLVISADCGIKAMDFVEVAREKGVDVIITDHHRAGEKLPEALAILNPVLPESGYPDSKLAGVGVIFKLIQALFEETDRASLLPHYLKLVSIGTIADIAELKGENRIFVKFGLKGLENVSNSGLRSLMEICGIQGKEVTVGDIGYRIGPRINAAGRIGKAELAVKLFLSSSQPESLEIAHHLDVLNSRRQRIEEKIFKQALKRIKENLLDKRYRLFVLGCDEWHRGVIGIVASKIKEVYHRPVILFAYENGDAFGSGRSISGFSLIECIEKCSEFFSSYGGHTLAVGCVLSQKEVTAFRNAINSLAERMLSDEILERRVYVDARINFNRFTMDFFEKFRLLSPFGAGNSKPIFFTEKVQVMSNPRSIQNKHSKFLVKQEGKTFEVMGWDKPWLCQKIGKGDVVDLVYSLQFSRYLGEERIILSLEDVKTPGEQETK